jgi:hypothetical protein
MGKESMEAMRGAQPGNTIAQRRKVLIRAALAYAIGIAFGVWIDRLTATRPISIHSAS